MNKVIYVLVLGVSSLGGVGGWAGEYDGLCSKQISRAQIANRALNDFDNMVVKPLWRAREAIAAELRREVERPRELDRSINVLANKMGPAKQREITEIAALDAAKAAYNAAVARGAEQRELRRLENQVKRAAKDLSETQSDIQVWEGRIASYQKEKNEIVNSEPTEQQLRTSLSEADTKLADLRALKDEKRREADEMTGNQNMCINFHSQRDSYDYFKMAIPIIRQLGCSSYNLPEPRNMAAYQGRHEALKAMDCSH